MRTKYFHIPACKQHTDKIVFFVSDEMKLNNTGMYSCATGIKWKLSGLFKLNAVS